ncbi:MAG: hypothetical protein U0670_17400 [Anaerolineae bacterium]
MSRRRLGTLLFIGFASLLLLTQTAFAAGAVTINTLAFVDGSGCQYVFISVSVAGVAPGDPPLHIEIYKNGSSIVSQDVGLVASFSQGFVADAVNGDVITATASMGSTANAGPLVCGGGGSTGTGSSSSSSGGGPNDGRLNWTADEYYALYCAYDQLEVWRGVPSGLMLASFSMANLLALPAGGSTEAGGVTMTRLNEDMFQAAGSNGNTAPSGGYKQFSMAACISANGGEPAQSSSHPASSGSSSSADYCTTPAGLADLNCYGEDLTTYCSLNNYPLPLCTSYIPGDTLTETVNNVIRCMFATFTPWLTGMAFLGLRRITRKQVL